MLKNKQLNLSKKVVLITGGSKGLGYHIAESFVKSGSNIMICSRNLIDLKKAYNKLNLIKKANQKIFYSVADISSVQQIKKLVSKTLNKFKKIDILINNAGIYGPKGNIEKINWSQWEKAIKVNLLGSVFLTREIIPHFKKNKKGKIIQLSGGGASSPLPFISGYAVSKAAIVRFVENISHELKTYNIDINAVAPGPLKVTNLILFLSSKKSDGISGKLISALWDNWENWPNFKKILKTKDIYTLRRIIGRDRGYRWGDK